MMHSGESHCDHKNSYVIWYAIPMQSNSSSNSYAVFSMTPLIRLEADSFTTTKLLLMVWKHGISYPGEDQEAFKRKGKKS